MQRYDSYKDSGIQWLGEIPSHWEVFPLKHAGRFRKGLLIPNIIPLKITMFTKSQTVSWNLGIHAFLTLNLCYAQQYALCLPDKVLLQQKLREWIDEFRKEK